MMGNSLLISINMPFGTGVYVIFFYCFFPVVDLDALPEYCITHEPFYMVNGLLNVTKGIRKTMYFIFYDFSNGTYFG